MIQLLSINHTPLTKRHICHNIWLPTTSTFINDCRSREFVNDSIPKAVVTWSSDVAGWCISSGRGMPAMVNWCWDGLWWGKWFEDARKDEI
jgi:hypothetical protein